MKIKWKHVQQFQYFCWPMLWGSRAVSRCQVGWCAGPSTVAFMLEKIQNRSSWGWADGSVVKHSYSHRGPEFNSHHPSWCLTPHWNSSSRGPDVLSWTHSAHNKYLKNNNHKGLSYPALTAEQRSQSRLCGAMKDRKAQGSLSPALWKQDRRRQCRWRWSPALFLEREGSSCEVRAPDCTQHHFIFRSWGPSPFCDSVSIG